MKRLSALAQLVVLHGKHGFTSTKELVALTGYSRRAIVKAKCEAGCSPSENPSAHSEKPGAHQCAPQCSPGPALSRARIESTLRVDTLSQEVDSANAATSAVAFQGRVIKLLQRDFDRWKNAYPALTDLNASLQAADDYYAENPPPDGKWFFRVSRWLASENSRPPREDSGRGGVKKRWQDEPSVTRRLIAEAVASCAKLQEAAQ